MTDDPHAPDAGFGPRFDEWFDRVFDFSFRILWDEQAAADVSEATFLTAARTFDPAISSTEFGLTLLQHARPAALGHPEFVHRGEHVTDDRVAVMQRAQFWPEDSIGTIDDAAQVAEHDAYIAMLWDAADVLGERDREILDLHLRHLLDPPGIARVAGLSDDVARQLVPRVEQRMDTAVGARVLWRLGEPVCSALGAAYVDEDIEHFDSDAVRITDRHAATCPACAERKHLGIAPTALFAAIPMLSFARLRTGVAYELDAAGVPMAGAGSLHGRDDAGPRRGRRRLVLGVAAAMIVAIIVGAALAYYNRSNNTVAVTVPPSTTRPSTTSTSSSTTSTSTSTSTSSTTTSTTSTTVAPILVPPTKAPATTAPVTTTTSTVPVTVTFTLTPANASTTYAKTDAPLLAWYVTGVHSLHVYGTTGDVDTTANHRNVAVCPGTWSGETCTIPQPGSYVYTLDAFNAAGTRILHRTLTLAVS